MNYKLDKPTLEEAIESMKSFITGENMSCVTAQEMKVVITALKNSIAKENVMNLIKQIELEKEHCGDEWGYCECRIHELNKLLKENNNG